MAKKTGEKYQAIIEAAVKVIAENGYHNAQVTKIARVANVADGTIYLYFDSKEDILISLFHEKMGEFIRESRERIEKAETATDKLKQLVVSHFSHLSTHVDFAYVTQVELRQSNPRIRQGIRQSIKSYLQLIDQVVELGMEESVFRADIPLFTIRKMIFGTLDEAVTSWIMNDRKHDLMTMADPIHELFIHGLKCK
ncbi:TetR/AcrR family transcriptional regulator [Ammoniphilus sp. CFH 90114]|uniref:TetR/AcrR family transcriptional regulator n=1 Tax=Ammoniphilus sp. CFH 90114 TaxID=2493665 RepID=UPI00100FF903|nr:TetR/AcrR family transcriptional regulator [Ammoniphilus sp. CFH 90114]RXT14648.1 TetR/AcrR family transcriptional regulator [Ammoniphilus sp. CFH 90114]